MAVVSSSSSHFPEGLIALSFVGIAITAVVVVCVAVLIVVVVVAILKIRVIQIQDKNHHLQDIHSPAKKAMPRSLKALGKMRRTFRKRQTSADLDHDELDFEDDDVEKGSAIKPKGDMAWDDGGMSITINPLEVQRDRHKHSTRGLFLQVAHVFSVITWWPAPLGNPSPSFSWVTQAVNP